MAQVNVGDIKEIRWNNRDAGIQGKYYSKSGESHSLDPGGRRTDDSDDNIDTGGNFIAQQKLQPWCYEATVMNAEGDSKRMELESLSQLSGLTTPTDFIFVSINDIAYTASGCVVGDIKVDRQTGKIPIKVMGGGNPGSTQFAEQLG